MNQVADLPGYFPWSAAAGYRTKRFSHDAKTDLRSRLD